MSPPPSNRGGSSRGAGAARGGNPRSGGRGGFGGPGSLQTGLRTPSVNVVTVGEPRRGVGKAGKPIRIRTNHFETTIPQGLIYHYDVAISSERLPSRLNFQLIKQLQCSVAADVFTPRAAYDGRKNMFAMRELPLGSSNSAEFDVTLPQVDPNGNGGASNRPPTVYKIKVTQVNVINPEVLERFINGQHSQDEEVFTALAAMNVAIRMAPSQSYPFNVRSFFTDQESRSIGGGLQLWRGYFQSVRPAVGRLLINVDISTGLMYKSGTLIDLCLDFFGKRDPNIMDPTRGFPERERLRLQRFIGGMRVLTRKAGSTGRPTFPRTIRKLSAAGANRLTFTIQENGQDRSISVNDWFRRSGTQLQHPGIICIEVGNGALIPMEMCEVPKGQIVRKQVPPEKTNDVVAFSTKKPSERFSSIMNGLNILQYGQSEYVRQFGMIVKEEPININARVLNAPTLRYGGTKQPTIQPRNGQWNMVDKQLYKPATIGCWVLAVLERGFGDADARNLAERLVKACRALGMPVADNVATPFVQRIDPNNVTNGLRTAGQESFNKTKAAPTLFVVVLPDNANDVYAAVKYFGDCMMGVPTQCLKTRNCKRLTDQFLANVALKINVKLGGVNVVPDRASAASLIDPNHPTIVMGADVMHPPPGSEGRPSFASLVASVDSFAAKYVATTRVQESRQEIISDLEEMASYAINMYKNFQINVEKSNKKPDRVIFFRDGVAEGQFQQVKDNELMALKRACKKMDIDPKITMIIVGKRHHTRFGPVNQQDADKSGNCPAGTVVDTEIVHPVEFDFYLQSHGGLLGTSRSSHYSVLYDENGFTPDELQALSFALCHVYARSTRSVSIPAPVYYADTVCSRAKYHYDPNQALRLEGSDAASVSSSAIDPVRMVEMYRNNFKQLHKNQEKLMYFQ